MTISPDLLIPPDSELAHLLLQWSETEDTRTWNIANLTNELIEELEGDTVTKKEIYKAVAVRCKGRKPNTIRRIAEVAADFDAETQETYSGLLSFEHFKTSRRLFNEGYTPSIDYALSWSVSGNDYKLGAGRFHTVGDMLNQFLPKDSFENQLQDYWFSHKERLYDLIVIHDNDSERKVMQDGFDKIDAVVSALTRIDSRDTIEIDMEAM
jgi:hypothetical protein